MYLEGTEVEFDTELRYSNKMPVQILHFKNNVDVLSSSIINGGCARTDTIVIIEVPKDWDCEDPMDYSFSILKDLNLPDSTVVFLTAAEVEYVFNVVEKEYNGTKVASAVTAGLSNQVVAGEVLTDWEHRHELSIKRMKAMIERGGTINILSIVSTPLTIPGKVNLIIPMTEAKTVAMRKMGYTETGTTSDAVAVISPIGEGTDYAGTGSDIGIAVSRSVTDAVCKALIIRDDFPEDTDEETKRGIRNGFKL